MKRKMIVFISGKYSGNVDENIAYAETFARVLWDEGYTVVCPHLNTANFNEDGATSWKDYLQGDLEILSRCDIVFALPNWKDSKGSKIEIDYALRKAIPVVESKDMLDMYYETIREEL